MTTVEGTLCPRQIEDWTTLPWKKYQRDVFRLQQRIYRAACRGDWKRVHSLQRLLLHSWSARCLAVRRVTQENRGKRTPGIDGVASLTPIERLTLAKRLRNWSSWTVAPIRRTYIPKPGTDEKRGLGIPVMADRACQALVKLALEPEWEAQFEPNSYGFRPGRSPHDAIEAIFSHIRLKPKFVFDADFEKCFDRIDRNALLKKLNTIRPIERLIRDWLKAGIWDGGQWVFPEAGTPQGGTISPLLANIALHGLEETIAKAVHHKSSPAVIRFADDLVVLHQDLEVLKEAIKVAEVWATEMGLNFKVSKTRIIHTLDEYEGNVGFDFLGFHIQQYRVGKYRTYTYRGKPGYKTIIKPSPKAIKRHGDKTRSIIRQYRGAPQAGLIRALNPIIRGWTNYYRTCVAKRVFSKTESVVYHQLAQWAHWRHPRKTRAWRYRRYWKRSRTRMEFSDGKNTLFYHADTPIIRHIKVRGNKSPFDGDWAYWSARLGRDPTKPRRVTKLLKRQEGRCVHCGLRFMSEDVMEVHHKDGDRKNNRLTNFALLHVHCHDQIHGMRYQ
jgi:RNA-directed DNA polymerase